MTFEDHLVEAVHGVASPDRLWEGAIVIQGPYYPYHTERAVREFLERNSSNTLVILSSYFPLDPKDLLSAFEYEVLTDVTNIHYGRFVCISCRRPEVHEFWSTNFANQNMQRVSSFVGLRFAKEIGCEMALKVRSDSFLAVRNLVLNFKAIIESFPLNPDPRSESRRSADEISPQKARILVTDRCIVIDNRPDLAIYGHYFIGDEWFFGVIEDLIRYFDVRDRTLWNRGKTMPVGAPAETNLCLQWKREMRLREDMNVQEMLARYFVVAERNDTLFFWHRFQPQHPHGMKLEDAIRSLPKSPNYYPQTEWLKSLQHYKTESMAQQYSAMQRAQYERGGEESIFRPGVMENDHVVGTFHAHNAWPDNHEFLIRHSTMGETRELIALDFACGPGRNILLYQNRFKRIDGVDIGEANLKNAKVYTSVLPEEKRPVLYHCNGLDLQDIASQSYDVIFSTIALQHICCHSIRYGYLKEFSRILKPEGFLCVQMGYGTTYPEGSRAVPYFENVYDSPHTNGRQDTRIENPKDVEKDLTECGFSQFEYNIRPSGPGDLLTPNWIYWSAVKA